MPWYPTSRVKRLWSLSDPVLCEPWEQCPLVLWEWHHRLPVILCVSESFVRTQGLQPAQVPWRESLHRGCRENAFSTKGLPRPPPATQTLRRARWAPWPTLYPRPCPLAPQARPHSSHGLKSAVRAPLLRGLCELGFPPAPHSGGPDAGRSHCACALRRDAPRAPPPAAGLGTAGTAVGVLRGSGERRDFQILPLEEWQRPGLWRGRWRDRPWGVPSSAWRAFLPIRWVTKGPASGLHATVVPRPWENPRPRLLSSGDQKQKEGLGGRTFEAPRELRNLRIPHRPRFLMELTDPSEEAMPEFRRAFPGAPAGCFPAPCRVGTLPPQPPRPRVGDAGEMQAPGFPRSPPEARGGQFASGLIWRQHKYRTAVCARQKPEGRGGGQTAPLEL